MRSGMRADYGPERVFFRAELRPKWSDFRFERADLRSEMVNFGHDNPDLGPERADFGPERSLREGGQT